MNTAISTPEIFTFQESHKVRTIKQANELWFVAKDVFVVLGLTWNGARTLALIPEAWRLVVKFTTNQKEGVVNLTTPCESQAKRGFGDQNVHVINFKALCKIAFRSNKPEADAFTNWAAEVIDTVMKTGSYVLPTAKAAIETITPTQYHNLRLMVNSLACGFHRSGSWEHWAWKHVRALASGEVAAKLPVTMYDQAVNVLKSLEVEASLFLSQQHDRETEFLRQDRAYLVQRVQMSLPLQ
jgi:prophage antirepressor-like protein